MKALLLRIFDWFRPGTKRSNWQQTLATIIKYGIMIAAMVYIWWRLEQEERSIWDTLLSMNTRSWMLVCFSFFLIPVNLAWEAAKWRTMVRKVYPDLKYKTAYEAVLVGITAGIFTPNGIGAYAGRVFWLRAGRRLEAAVLTLGDRLCQMAITIWTAQVALEILFFIQHPLLSELPQGLLQTGRGLLWMGSIAALAISLFPGSLYQILLRIGIRGKITSRVSEALLRVDRNLLLRVLALGLARYITFSGQYLILLYAFGYQYGILLAISMIVLVFFSKSLLPSVSFSELGVRESVALTIMGAAGIAAPITLAATFLLYVFNQIVPALAGLVLTPRLKTDV